MRNIADSPSSTAPLQLLTMPARAGVAREVPCAVPHTAAPPPAAQSRGQQRAKVGVRAARASDIDEMVAMARAFHAASSLCDVPICEPKLRGVMRHAINAADHACLVYQRADGSLSGMMIGYVIPHFFSTELMASDLMVFVRPGARGSLAAARLWSAFREWAVVAGARTLCFGTIAGIAPERTRRFYTGLGMHEVGSLYLQPLNTTAASA